MAKTKPRIFTLPPEELAKYQRETDHEVAHRYARELHYSPRRREFQIALNSGVTIAIPLAMITELASATPAQIRRVKLDQGGGAISLRDLDVDVSVSGLIRDVLGFGELQQIRAARVRTPKKAAAARANGAKGGRPRKNAA